MVWYRNEQKLDVIKDTYIPPPNLPTGLALSPDNRHAVVYGLHFGGTTLRLWNLEEGKEVRRPEGHQSAVASMAFSPDGRYLISFGNEAHSTLWSLESKKPVGEFKPTNSVSSIAISPDGRYALFGSKGSGSAVCFWQIESPRNIAAMFQPYPVNTTSVGVAFSPDGRFALSAGSSGHALHLWDVENLAEVRAFGGENQETYRVVFSPNGKQAVSGGGLGIVRLWDVTTGKEIRSLSGHAGAVTGVAYAPDGHRILSGSSDATVRLWDLQEDKKEGRVLEGSPKGAITCVAYAPDGKTFAASGQDGRITLWNAATEKPLWHTQLPGAVLGLANAGDSRHLATANASGTVYILRLPEASGGR